MFQQFESLIQVPETQSTIRPRAQRNAFSAIAAIMVSIVRSIGGYKPPFPIPEKQSAYHPRAG
jgi:hypothetical protein